MPLASLTPQGPVAETMADLWWLMLALGTVVFAVFLGMLAVALLRRPSDEQADDRRESRWIAGWGAIGPFFVILVVFVATVAAMRVVPSEAPEDALVIEIVGHRWWYEVHYPGQGVSTRNELHLPTGRPVALRLTSADVIHSFWVPSLGGKRDMLPDGVNTLVLQADEPGVHRSQCAEFCGLYHTDMALTVVAEPTAAFNSWIDGLRTSAQADSPSAPPAVSRTAPTGSAA